MHCKKKMQKLYYSLFVGYRSSGSDYANTNANANLGKIFLYFFEKLLSFEKLKFKFQKNKKYLIKQLFNNIYSKIVYNYVSYLIGWMNSNFELYAILKFFCNDLHKIIWFVMFKSCILISLER